MIVWDRHVHTAVFKVDNQQGPTVWHKELCSMLSGSQDGRGVWGRIQAYVGEGNGTPLQYSCLEKPMDRGAW